MAAAGAGAAGQAHEAAPAPCQQHSVEAAPLLAALATGGGAAAPLPGDLGTSDPLAGVLASLDCRSAVNVLYALARLRPAVLKGLLEGIQPAAAQLLVDAFEGADEWMDGAGPCPAHEDGQKASYPAAEQSLAAAEASEGARNAISNNQQPPLEADDAGRPPSAGGALASSRQRNVPLPLFGSKHEFYSALYGTVDDAEALMARLVAGREALGAWLQRLLLDRLLPP